MPVIVCKVMPSDASKSRPAEKIKALNALVDGLVKADPMLTRCDTWSIFANADGNCTREEFLICCTQPAGLREMDGGAEADLRKA